MPRTPIPTLPLDDPFASDDDSNKPENQTPTKPKQSTLMPCKRIRTSSEIRKPPTTSIEDPFVSETHGAIPESPSRRGESRTSRRYLRKLQSLADLRGQVSEKSNRGENFDIIRTQESLTRPRDGISALDAALSLLELSRERRPSWLQPTNFFSGPTQSKPNYRNERQVPSEFARGEAGIILGPPPAPPLPSGLGVKSLVSGGACRASSGPVKKVNVVGAADNKPPQTEDLAS